MKQTRRQIVKSLIGLLAGGGTTGKGTASASNTINRDKTQLDIYNKNMTSGYVTLPGFCFSTLYSHLPQLLHFKNHRPVIIVDQFDYDRLMGRVVRERSNQDVQIRGTITDFLRRQGVLKTIDYSKYYTAEEKERTLKEYRTALEAFSEHENEQIATQALEGYERFGRGDYVRPFRTGLGNWQSNIERRDLLQQNQQRIERGLNDPVQFNEDLAAQYIAALTVQQSLNQHPHLDSVGILGQGEQQSIARVLRGSDVNLDVLDVSQSGKTLDRVGQPSIHETKSYHEVFRAIETAAHEATGVQHHDWFTVGPRLSVLQHPELYDRADMDVIEEQTKTVAEETKGVLRYLDKEAADNQITHVLSRAERIAQEQETTNQETQEIAKQLNQQTDLANHSRDIRSLMRSDRFSEEALFVASSIKTDPNARRSTDWIHRRAKELQNRLSPVTVPDNELRFFIDRGDFKRGAVGNDWFHAHSPQRRQTIPQSS